MGGERGGGKEGVKETSEGGNKEEEEEKVGKWKRKK
jgi:hypothetical protein